MHISFGCTVFDESLITFQVETKRATPREARDTPESSQSVKKVFVGGIPEEVEDEEIKAYFEEVIFTSFILEF